MMNKNVESINHLLRQLMLEQQRIMTADLNADSGLTPQQARALSVIHRHPGIIQRELADTFQRRSASISNLLQILQRDGYITRKVPTESERTKQIYLTPKGQAAIAGFDAYYDTVESRMVKNLSPVEQQTLIGLLEKMVGSYDPPAGALQTAGSATAKV
ncbi:hypothetical protein FC75_GL000964 [Lacticaseibacillus camelliae DSM 22697 = JCM 13995]|uniref:HTH marR-type domain-containing protein n=2 Tax=Lacticaseibacillus camelliae TaxID=381742 RepID=A0A0R2FKZ4_9LACO|nr:hypothetical protein FC75_GL000964 [Lacticaseibacillus camelliae DSM 22697 = JCM 13995]